MAAFGAPARFRQAATSVSPDRAGGKEFWSGESNIYSDGQDTTARESVKPIFTDSEEKSAGRQGYWAMLLSGPSTTWVPFCVDPGTPRDVSILPAGGCFRPQDSGVYIRYPTPEKPANIAVFSGSAVFSSEAPVGVEPTNGGFAKHYCGWLLYIMTPAAAERFMPAAGFIPSGTMAIRRKIFGWPARKGRERKRVARD
jgi:hypothetical protein